MKKLLLLIFMFICLTAYTQNKKAIKLFDKGVIAFNEKRFKEADSLFALSLKMEPNADTYFNLAAVKNELGDRCGFCENINKSISFGNTDAVALYIKNCIKNDTLYYKNIKEPNVVFYCIKSDHICLKNKFYYVYKEYQEKGQKKSGSFYVDTNMIKVTELISPNCEIEKFFKENMPYSVVEEMPYFPEGDEARIKFITENLVYPAKSKYNNIQGTVYVTFIIEPDGTINDVKILRGIGGGCDEECIRIIKLMPKWIPGKLNGKPVRVQYNLPIKFTLN